MAKRRAENLIRDEFAKLIALTNEREIAHARRMKYLVEPAHLRQTSLDAVMDALGSGLPAMSDIAYIEEDKADSHRRHPWLL
jgi:hypothetical protein